MVQTSLGMETPIKESISRENQMVSDSTNGRTVHFILETLGQVLNMERVSGEKVARQIAISMRESIIWTRSMAMGCLIGRVEICTKGIIKRTRGKVMGRCTGSMVQSIKGNGNQGANMVLAKCSNLMVIS